MLPTFLQKQMNILSVSASELMPMAKETCSAEEDDACTICLEPFSALDPSTVTGCKHEYHLHCIIEWSQRSKECPICSQILVLKDPVSQELLAAAGTEMHEIRREAPYINYSDYDEERMMQHHAAQYYQRNKWQESNLQGKSPTIGCRYPVKSADSSTSSQFPSVTIGESSSVNIQDCLLKRSSSPIDGSGRSSSSELLSFSNSIRSKLSAASTRCQESISKGTNGFKEKLLARNTSVKELSREVHCRMNAGVAGVSKMIKRIDLSSKRVGASAIESSCKVETSNLTNKEKDVQDNMVTSTKMLSSD